MALFGRYTEITIGPAPEAVDAKKVLDDLGVPVITGRSYDTGKYINGVWRKGFKIEFTVSGESESKTDETIVEIWNMGKFGNLFGENSDIIIDSGYLEHHGVIFSGTIQEIIRSVDGPDNITKFVCKEQVSDLLNVSVDDSFVKGTKWSDVIKTLVGYTAVQVGYIYDDEDFKVEEDRYYIHTGMSIKRWIDTIISSKMGKTEKQKKKVKQKDGNYKTEEVDVWVGKWKWYIRNGLFYGMPTNYAFPSGLRVSAKTGLLSVTKADTAATGEKKDEWVVKMLLVPKINKDTIFLVEYSPIVEQYGDVIYTYAPKLQFYKTQSFKYKSTDVEHIVEVNVKEISSESDAYQAFREGIPIEFEDEYWEEDDY